MTQYINLPECATGYTSIEVLAFLKGRKLDDVSMGFLHAVRPSSIRVIGYRQGQHMDCRQWRVSVYLNKDETIKEITQEVTVGLYGGIENGYDLNCRLKNVPYNKSSVVIVNPKAICKILIVDEKPKWQCKRCKTYVLDGRCKCKKSPSPWEPI